MADVELTLPEWVAEEVVRAGRPGDDAALVRLAVALSRRNVQEGTGGPFGAVVCAGGRVMACGVNLVVPAATSAAHAEIMALSVAQQRARRFRLNEGASGPVTLATSAQPCAMCFGAVLWAGIDRLLIGARGEDVESLTDFDEGPLVEDWVAELERRGIEVVRDVEREAARVVLAAYGDGGGARY